MNAKLNFVRQQGFPEATPEGCGARYAALMLQPRALGILVLVGVLLQDWAWFIVLSGVLWWNVLVPTRNPFDAIYNRFAAKPRGLPPLGPAPAPRRFSQGMAGTFLLTIGLCLGFGVTSAAWIVEGLMLVALAALIFGRFCLGSFVYLHLTGRGGLARRTLPWSEGPPSPKAMARREG